MPDGSTTERPPVPKPGHEGPFSGAAPCGRVVMQPAPLVLRKGTIVVENPVTKVKQTHIRYSVDNFIFFIPPKDATCTYWFMQFVHRTATVLNADGTEKNPPQADPAMSREWQPDIRDWNKRNPPTFLDPHELGYPPDLVERDPKSGAIVRRDGPGYSHHPNTPLRNRRLHWDFKIYVICECPDGMKLASLVEFSFDIVVDKKGVPRLEAPAAGQPGYPQATMFCCRFNEDFFTWIDRWHSHPLANGGKDQKGNKKSYKSFYSTLPGQVGVASKALELFRKGYPRMRPPRRTRRPRPEAASRRRRR